MRSAFSPLAVLAITACATVPAAAPVRGDRLALLGQATRVGVLVVTPQRVIEDSRCPINARCVWAGRLIVATDVKGNGWQERRNLTLGEPVALHGTTLTLTSAEPGKLAGEKAPALPTTFGFDGGR
jgi:hypothetical protein